MSNVNHETEILRRLDVLTAAIVDLARVISARLTCTQMCERLGVTSNTLTSRVRRGEVPTPGADGKWLLSGVVVWESGGTDGRSQPRVMFDTSQAAAAVARDAKASVVPRSS